jgi:tetratricopeptide (TPR) repeat protein
MSVSCNIRSNGNRQQNCLRALLVLSGCLLPLLSVRALPADDATSRYFEQLRRRRLFSLAEFDCLQRLSQKRVSPVQRVVYTLELSRTFAEHAKYTAGNEQTDLWNRAAQVIDEFFKKDPQNPRRVLLEVQRALIPAAEGEFYFWQVEMFPSNENLRKQAQAGFDDAISKLRELEKALHDRQRKASQRKGRRNEPLPLPEVRTLLFNVRYQLGIALLNRAKLDPADSANRMSGLIDAELWLKKPAKGVPGEATTWTSQLLLAESSRLRGDLKQAAALLTKIKKDNPPQQVRDQVVAQRVLILLSDRNPTEAAQLLVNYRRLRKSLPGELSFLKVKVSSALWKTAKQNNKPGMAAQLMEQVETHVEWANREVGGYWGRRSRLLLEFMQESQKYGINLAQRVRKAKSLYGQGRVDEAIDEYGTAAVAARRSGNPELAVELGYTRASIQLQAGKQQQAADGFHDLAEQFPHSRRAPAAHLLWAYCLGKLYDQSRTRSRRQAYTAALRAHREKFADDPTEIEASWMLARLEERRLQVTRALKLYLAIPSDHRRGPEAQVGAARCYEFILERLRELRQPTDAWEKTAVNQLGRFVSAFPAEPQGLSLPQAEVALRSARIHLNSDSPNYMKADRLLERVFSSHAIASKQPAAPNDSATWKSLSKTATQLRIVSLAGQHRFSQADLFVRKFSETNPSEVLSVLDGLMQLAAHAEPTTRRGLGELQLQAAGKLYRRRLELSAEEQQRLDRCLAQAYVATNQPKKAIAVYEGLLRQSPRNRRLLKTVSQLLVECGTPECLESAKSHWRKLESAHKAGSQEWLNTRYHVAWCSFKLKEYNECRKLLGVTRLLYPDLGGDELRGKFTKLEKVLNKRR